MVVVKIADHDFEVVASLFPAGTVSTLGTASAFESAIAIARKGAADLNLEVIYTVGAIQT